METRLGEYLKLRDNGGRRTVVCRCGRELCDAGKNFKDFAVCSEFPLTRAAPRNSATDRFVLREFYCPGCATLLEVECALKGAPFVHSYSLAATRG